MRVEHTVAAMVAQQGYGLALGYEDLNDHEQPRHDPLLRFPEIQSGMENPYSLRIYTSSLTSAGKDPELTHRLIS